MKIENMRTDQLYIKLAGLQPDRLTLFLVGLWLVRHSHLSGVSATLHPEFQ